MISSPPVCSLKNLDSSVLASPLVSEHAEVSRHQKPSPPLLTSCALPQPSHYCTKLPEKSFVCCASISSLPGQSPSPPPPRHLRKLLWPWFPKPREQWAFPALNLREASVTSPICYRTFVWKPVLSPGEAGPSPSPASDSSLPFTGSSPYLLTVHFLKEVLLDFLPSLHNVQDLTTQGSGQYLSEFEVWEPFYAKM